MNSALIIMDVWEGNYPGRWKRDNEEVAHRINSFLVEFRKVGLVIHSPRGVKEWIASSENRRIRERTRAVGTRSGSPRCSKSNYGGVNDKLPQLFIPEKPGMARIRQHPSIEIHQETDYLTVDFREVLKLLESNSIKNLFYVGGATNICVLRSYPTSILHLRENLKGVSIFLIEDLSITLFDEEVARKAIGERDVEEYMHDFYNREICPTITSAEALLKAR